MIKKLFFIASAILFGVCCLAQEIPLGAWRIHNSYNAIHSIALSQEKVYAAASNGIAVVTQSDNSLTTLTKTDGLSGTGITSVAYDQTRNQLLISYSDGGVDIVRAKEIVQYAVLKDSETIPGSKKINHITIRENLAYLSADYGVVVFDLIKLEVKETWRDLGASGQTLPIFKSVFQQDSIFLATAKGILSGDIKDNLLDFARWKRFDQGSFNSPIQSVAIFNGKIYAAINGLGLYAYATGTWTLENFSGLQFYQLSGGSNLYITEGNNLWKLNTAGVYGKIVNTLIVQPRFALEDGNSKVWIADSRTGLISGKTGSFERFIPNGPTFFGSFRFGLNTNVVYAVSGGYSANYSPLMKNELVNYFSSGLWSANASLQSNDVTDIAFSGMKTFVSSFGGGLQVTENNTSTVYTNVNSPLLNNQVSAIAISADGLWVANYASAQPLHVLKNDNTWQSFSFPVSASQYPTAIMVDKLGQVWLALNPLQGGGILVFNKEKNQHVYLTDASGAGALPSRSVYSLAVDRDGQVWVGTGAGAAYFANPGQVFSGNINATKPIFSGRFLLRDETITTITVDGGNRKWMGTQRGVWLFDPFGEKQIYNFNSQNSPLLSDILTDIEIHPSTGEVFFGTDKGIVSFRSDATESSISFNTVKIFPNPVTAEFSGVVNISGLSTDATVKVTDISGKLIWQAYANGGTATWNVRDYNGRRAATGMYLVIAVSQDAHESIVGKIAIIN